MSAMFPSSAFKGKCSPTDSDAFGKNPVCPANPVRKAMTTEYLGAFRWNAIPSLFLFLQRGYSYWTMD
ncbi:MAG: hypothetical protein WCU80_01750 [Paludibacteraceae bacterium]